MTPPLRFYNFGYSDLIGKIYHEVAKTPSFEGFSAKKAS